MKVKKEQKVAKFATAFGMARTKLGYIVKEQTMFILSDDEEINLAAVTAFAKQNKCNIVEVWFREDNNWGEIKFYKTYNFYSTITSETFDKLDIYKS